MTLTELCALWDLLGRLLATPGLEAGDRAAAQRMRGRVRVMLADSNITVRE